MSREFKFRARWKDTGNVIEDYMNDYVLCSLNSEKLIIEQYTGLKDCNGKKIFEGDIVKYHDQGNVYVSDKYGAIVFHECKFQIKSKSAFANDVVFYALVSNEASFFAGKKTTIIGNIHDNPELIGGLE
jgi:uncharacterized phage protein (TIGR01671 family)